MRFSRDTLDFDAYAVARRGHLRRTAYLLCGDWHRAEDLTQDALAKLFLAWRRVRRDGDVDAYARKILVRCYVDEMRRPWRRERATDRMPEVAAPVVDVDQRAALLDALGQLGPRQRAVVVLRFWEDMSVEQVAEVLNVRSGTVKSQTARGLARLRIVIDRHVLTMEDGR